MDQPDPHHPPSRARRMFLAPRATPGDGHGYTYGPARRPDRDIIDDGHIITEPPTPEQLEKIRDATQLTDEPECVGPAILDGYAESAEFYKTLRHRHDVLTLRQIRPSLSVESRLADAHRRAKQNHVDLRQDLFIAGKMLERCQRAGGKPSAALLRKVEAIEAVLDGPVDELAEAA